MRAKRVPSHRQPVAPPRETAGGHTGEMIDWYGLQATGGGGPSTAEGAGLFVMLMAVRAAPYVVWRAVGRLARRRAP
jgi:hypothetical protein